MKKKLRITIVGAGNVGTQLAVHCAEKSHKVTIFNSRPDAISKHLIIVDENNIEIHSGDICCSTSEPMKAFKDADVIFITTPAFCMNEVEEKIRPFIREGIKICLVPGTGGGECVFKECINQGAVVFGIQRVPSVARLIEYGKVVRATGYRNKLHTASIPSHMSNDCARLMTDLLDMECEAMPNYLNLTLTPSNPVLHTTRLRNLFKDYEFGMTYSEIPLFYEDWNDETSESLLKCDDEIQAICSRLDMFDLSYVKSLREHYESADACALTMKISSIAGFKGLTSPSVKSGDGYVPDLNSRYFIADFPFGLSILVQIADFIGIHADELKITLEWYYKLSGNRNGFKYSDYGISCLKDFVDFYSV